MKETDLLAKRCKELRGKRQVMKKKACPVTHSRKLSMKEKKWQRGGEMQLQERMKEKGRHRRNVM